jgi:hypothetical protein
MTDLDVYEDKLGEIPIDHSNFPRVFRYFSQLLQYTNDPSDRSKWRTLIDLALKSEHPSLAMIIAMKLDDMNLIQEIYDKAPDESALQKQYDYMLSLTLQRIPVSFLYFYIFY